MDTAIWWIRRDLRLSDNESLLTALDHAQKVIPVFILDPNLLSSKYCGNKRLSFLFAGLRALDASLRGVGSYLLLRSGNPSQVLGVLQIETGAEAIYSEEDYSPYATTRDKKVVQDLPLSLLPGLTVHHPGIMLKSDKTPYTVYTPFKKVWQARYRSEEPRPAPVNIPTPARFHSEAIPGIQNHVNEHFPAGEIEAHRRLEGFHAGTDAPVFEYHDNRDRMDFDGTSRLSPYIRFGMLSARQVAFAAYQTVTRAQDQYSLRSAETWLQELIWREFYLMILYHFPRVLRSAFRSKLNAIQWSNDENDFAAWREGRTGYPIVDAGMRQLVQTGWMHNRARMIVASFLTKDLLIDWRWGERFFMQQLIDGDPAANNGGWQWVAGTGTDAAPYFRVFNPSLQGKKYDPAGVYIRTYLPELINVPNSFIHEPWLMPVDTQKQTGCIVGKDYPFPIVDHALARERVLRAFKV